MLSGMKKAILTVVTVMMLAVPALVEAKAVHYFKCADCHRSGLGLTDLSNNVCLLCHSVGSSGRTDNDGLPIDALGRFSSDDASDAMGTHPATPAKETSHYWATMTEVVPAAGATTPTTYATVLNGRYNLSRGKVICSRCHDPHQDATLNQKLLKVANDSDELCKDCHSPWNVANADAVLTHPVGPTTLYSSFSADSRFKPAIDPTNGGLAPKGVVRLVNGEISCTSCHGAHFTDSDATTDDGKAQSRSANPGYTTGLATGDGKMLRSDGERRSGPARNGPAGTAQLRSNLCQACHTYKMHGKGTVGDVQIGCLECHGGHAHNGGAPSAYVLRDVSPTAVPRRANMTNIAAATVTFPNYPGGPFARSKWSDNVNGTATGFCEACHGDVEDPSGIGSLEIEHLVDAINPCTACHKHNDPASLHSFNIDANAATCGQCHGFPPYLNLPGDRDTGGTDGGYARNEVDGTPYDYTGRTYFKDETQTAHKTHAGAALPAGPPANNPGTWYFVGSAGIENCMPCHGNSAGTSGGGHRINPTTDPDTFRNVNFNQFGTGNGNYTPSYNPTTAKCSSVYCHSNGAPRTGDASRDYTVVTTTPAWLGDGTVDGFTAIQGKANRCQFCHGNDATSMGAAQKKNSPAHIAHLNKGYGCEVCHIDVALDSATLEPNATDGRVGGEHINLVADVSYKMSGTPLSVAMATNVNGPTYNAAAGTCAIYCHDPLDTGNTVDWDSTAPMQCDSCHGGLLTDTSADGGSGPVASGSHAKHVSDPLGPQLGCSACHGAGADTGSHGGMLDGTVIIIPPVDGVTFASICEECHGYDGGPGEVLPVWGNAASTDCATCHSGSQTGASINGAAPDALANALTSGHNRPAASGAYGVSANPAANKACNDCHDANATGHFGGGYDKRLLAGVTCVTCHGVGGAAANNGLNAHQGKNCEACHDPHGTGNVFMIHSSQTTQTAYDTTGTGKFAGPVTFTAQSGADSYDEDDNADGTATEVNADDICATCHTAAAGTAHNNSNNTGSHSASSQLGTNCFTCHTAHTDANPFAFGAGTACNDCHGFPPATGAHRNGSGANDPELHSNTASNDKDVEDRTDCAFCHTGADLYTYDLGADQAAGGARGNHGLGQANRRSVLTTSVGYETTNFSCASACHASTAANGGRWTDTTGLNCNACHYFATNPTSAGNVTASNSEALGALAHNKHFDKNKLCSDCHTVDNGGNPLRGQLTHIIAPVYIGPGNDGTLVQGRANATQDAAAVVRSGMTYDDGLNTCSGGIGLGCHASGTPDWDLPIPATNAGCLECHTNTDDAAYNPTSGIHDNNPGPITSGVAHDGSFLYNGGAGTGDCVTCHTTAPSSAHMDGTLDSSNPTIVIAAGVGFTDGATPTCTTAGIAGCHLEGTLWARKWDIQAYNNDATRCAVCHGSYSQGWASGVIHAEAGKETRGSAHNNVGSSLYPCNDCHVLGSGAYTFTDNSNDWGGTSHHGDNQLQLNSNTTGFTDSGARAGCATVSCHGNDANHDFQKSTVYTVANTKLVTMAGDVPNVPCSGCHGGGTIGTSRNNYWPDSSNVRVENTAGAHVRHLTVLAQAVYGESVAQLLTDNGNGTADAKQKNLCTYCHNTPGADGDHGVQANLPAEVNTMYTMWSQALDDGVFTAASGTCATVDCHFNKTTPTAPTSYAWYSGSPGACEMCHLDVTAEAKHTAHTDAAVNFGRTIGCADCHDAATNWSTNTAPAAGHLNNTYAIAGAVAFTYDGSKSCGINDCHEDGKGGAPKTATYPWNGGALGNCTICHDASPTTDAHTKHLAAKVSSYVSGCTDCHTAETSAAHINNSVSYASKISAAPGNGSCTNSCHLSAEAGDWTGGAAAIACADCHSGSGASAYIGGDKTSVAGPNYMPQYAMHLVTPTVSGKVHTDTGLATACTTCHDGISAQATHVNGVWTADDADNTNDQNRGMFAAFTDGTPATCAAACHSAGTVWRYKWSATAANTDGTQCANCHGEYASGWTTGVAHTENPARGNGAHTEVGTGTFPCTDCHAFGTTNAAYPYAVTTNDWKATDGGATTLHGDGFITLNSTGTLWGRSGSRSGCTGCHEGATGTANGHDFPASALTSQTVAGDAPNVSGGCTTCHGDTVGGTEFAPDGSTYPDRAGAHSEHVHAIAVRLGGDTVDNRNASCDYCHPNPGEAGHNDNVVPANLHASGSFKYIIGGTADSGSLYNGPSADTCSNINCHANAPFTPHWYPDTIAPAAITDLAASAGNEPGAVTLTWTAVGDDGTDDGTAYQCDVRFSTGTINAANFASASQAGKIPSVMRSGRSQTMVVEGLSPGTTYSFAVKTRDLSGNWALISNVVSRAADTDTTAPVFYGIETAQVADESGAVNLTWDPAVDHSEPVTYDVWWDINPITYGPANATTQAKSLRVVGLTPGDLYNFAVRARDAAGNSETNTFQKQLLVELPEELPRNLKLYYSNSVRSGTGPYTLTMGSAYASAATSDQAVATGTSMIWYSDAAYSVDTNVFGITFDVYIKDTARVTGQKVTTELGFWNGSSFTPFAGGTPVTTDIGRRSARVRKLPINSYNGMVPAGSRVAVRVNNTGANDLGFRYGSTTYKGLLTVKEQTYNHLPATFTLNQPSGSGVVNLSWSPASEVDAGQSVHYDVYGSVDNGATWPIIIAYNIPGTTTTWDTKRSAVALAGPNNQVKVMVDAGDSFLDGTGTLTHRETISNGWTVDNSIDNRAPTAVIDLLVEARPKQGSFYLHWTATGDDENSGRAAAYDIRYSTAPIDAGNFASATQAGFEPAPAFSGDKEGYELLGLNPQTAYYVALKVGDEAGNWSAISNVVSATSGDKCGICHATPPNEVATAGNHVKHGYTVDDCTKCHGDEVLTYALDHQDGQLKFGFGRDGSGAKLPTVTATVAGSNVSYWQNGVKIYEDTTGAGGFNLTSGDGIDNGTCMGYNGVNASGCHGPATPQWNEGATLACSACHGTLGRTADPYGRTYDDITQNGPSAKVIASPPLDNHGNSTGKYVGQHEKHLNFSFRFSKGDSCRLCHKANNHADGTIDIQLDLSAAGSSAVWTANAGGPNTPGSCAGTSDITCHGVLTTPTWDDAVAVDCMNCHAFGGTPPSHVTDPSGSGFLDDGKGNCAWCHVEGHPQGAEAGTVLIGNNPAVGIEYRSGGIHLKTVIGARNAMNDSSPVDTEAEVCWACHEDNGISEWGTNNKAATGSSPYNYGSLNQTNWIGATWTSANFSYKTGSIQSTHSADSTGTSALTGSAFSYTETMDTVDKLRCAWCHDVHNRNLAKNDVSTGSPYLRGSWMGNPYAEDGAPQSTTTYVNVAVGSYGYGAVPRGGTGYTRKGGYYIDQNNIVPNTMSATANGTANDYPTTGWTLESSAGLCTLCHGKDVDNMDKLTGENLWVGTNGHSNAAVGGAFSNAANIFGDGVQNRPTPAGTPGSLQTSSHVPNMGNQYVADISVSTRAYSYRGSAASGYTPYTSQSENRDFNAFDWGVTVDAGTIDVMFHQFSCSKCHNPHASRLPKLMITNCLDVQKNQWDSNKAMQSKWTNAALQNVDRKTSGTTHMRTAYYASAQNCHRYTRPETSYTPANPGGWNKVTPWNGAY